MADPEAVELYAKASALLDKGKAESRFTKRASALNKASRTFAEASRHDPRYEPAQIARHKEDIQKTLFGMATEATARGRRRLEQGQGDQAKVAMTEALVTEHGNTAEQYLLRGLCGQWIGGTPAERTCAHKHVNRHVNKEAVKNFTAPFYAR